MRNNPQAGDRLHGRGNADENDWPRPMKWSAPHCYWRRTPAATLPGRSSLLTAGGNAAFSGFEHLSAGRRQDLTAVLHVQRGLQARRLEVRPHHLLGRLKPRICRNRKAFSAIASASSTTEPDNRETMPQPQRLVGVDHSRRQDQVRTPAPPPMMARQRVADPDVAGRRGRA